MLDDQSSKNKSILFNIFESEKYISDNSDIKEFNSNVNNNDGELLLSSYTTNNEKDIKKN